MDDNNKTLSKAEALQVLTEELLRVCVELKTVEDFLLEVSETGKASPGTYKKLKLYSITEAIELLQCVYPQLKKLQREQAVKEAMELFGVNEEELGTLTKH